MKRILFAGFAAAGTLSAATASALPVQWAESAGGNGHWYEYVLDWGASWTEAQSAAAASTYDGMTGYLVTITSAAENAFVRAQATAQYPWGGASNIHIGATDSQSEGNWTWADGPDAGLQLSDGYDNWSGSEPPFWADYAMMDTSGNWFGTDGYGSPYMIEYSPAAGGSAAAAVPLPASGLLLAGVLGLGGIAARRARRRSAGK